MSEAQGFEALQKPLVFAGGRSGRAEDRPSTAAPMRPQAEERVARVWIKPGQGPDTINGRDQEVYFAPRACA